MDVCDERIFHLVKQGELFKGCNMRGAPSFSPGSYRESIKFESKQAFKGWGHDQLRGFTKSPYVTGRITVDEVTDAIDKLSDRQNERLSIVLTDPAMAKHYGVLQRSAKQLYETEFYDKYIVDQLKRKSIISVEPGTVGQFLFGNLVSNNISEPNCSPIHIGAIPLDSQSIQACDRQVWYYDGQLFHQLTKETHPPLEKADIYISNDNNTVNVNSEQMEFLKNHGIRWVTFHMLSYDTNSEDHQVDSRKITQEIDIFTIPETPSEPHDNSYESNHSNDSSNDSSYLIWIVIVVIVMIIIGFILYWIGLNQGYYMGYYVNLKSTSEIEMRPSTTKIPISSTLGPF
jgi:hypothetical protein